MKVAIVTLFGDNYGNKLQNYALQALLESMDHEVKTIIVKDGVKLNCPESRKDRLKKLTPKYVFRVMLSRFKNKYPYKNQRDGIRASIKFGKTESPKELTETRRTAFKSFSDQFLHIVENTLFPGESKYIDIYDAYICGSDQIWNPTYKSTGSAYFLQFAPEYKRIAFAPSFGLSRIPDALHTLYKKWLNGIPYLSVREEQGAKIIKELTGRDALVVPDPTLCLNREQWEEAEKKPEFADGQPYVLTYFLGNETNKYRRFIEAYAKQAGAKIINLFDMREPEYYVTDPAEFIWLIHHAKAMFTDSFHGTVFSIIFHTPFLVFDRIESGGTKMSSRIETLLKMTNLENQQFGKGSEKEFSGVDFSSSDYEISIRAELAKEYLIDSLYKVKEESREITVREPLPFVQENKNDCTGCAACVGVCPVNCITMEADKEGFRYPKIDLDKCIHCNKCRKLCEAAQSEIVEKRNEKAYVSYSKNTEIRFTSSSGGMFSELANRVIDSGGSVYGVGFTENWHVTHQCAESKSEVEKLRGSKYVQSEMDSCFVEIRDKLEQDKLVYFSGTPCQVDGLLTFLNKEYDNLITQDIICHGVPSPEVWKEYVNIRSKGQPISRISFRDKTYGWHYFSMCIETNQKNYVKRLDEDVYTRLFLDNVILRPSCYNCHHKHLHRKADITIADCWGNTSGVKDDDKGISLIFANTEKGQRLISEISGNLEMNEIPFEKAVSSQGAMTKSVPYNQNRDLFFSLVEESGMRKTIEKWYGGKNPVLLKSKIGYRKYKLAKIIKR